MCQPGRPRPQGLSQPGRSGSLFGASGAGDGFHSQNRIDVIGVGRLKEEHFIAGPDERRQRAEETFGRAARDADFRRGVVAAAVEQLNLLRERLT